MYQRKMLGSTIYRLRKEKGLSQNQLGELVGVSNKAVSKWETDEANPDISILPLLANVFEITLEELFNGEQKSNEKCNDVQESLEYNNYFEASIDNLFGDTKKPKEEIKEKKAKLLNFDGTVTNNAKEYEFTSDKKTKKGTPYLHVHFGKTLAAKNIKAKGIIAIGNNAHGIISFGIISKGIVSIGLFSIGILSIGLISLGLLSISAWIAFGGVAISSVAIGAVAFGGVAIGVFAFGGVAIGYTSFGGLSIGYHAYTGVEGIGLGKYIYFK